ncbi:hypothetical protein ml_78 [Mollivirus sibericum]|uniref:hypothetical protein n=1 Tax=Mollivirus sibericum TaxID=1678078 RepID=UPI0006B2EF94|nr:hypothetical protein ml_78 [Mollivirus sibericum]ALD61880.1 hypothetical protein ml_78 [Mollivirus sibericum]
MDLVRAVGHRLGLWHRPAPRDASIEEHPKPNAVVAESGLLRTLTSHRQPLRVVFADQPAKVCLTLDMEANTMNWLYAPKSTSRSLQVDETRTTSTQVCLFGCTTKGNYWETLIKADSTRPDMLVVEARLGQTSLVQLVMCIA